MLKGSLICLFLFVLAYESLELFAFLLLGIICGLASFCFVTLQRKIVLFSRRKSKFHLFIQKQPLMYPLIVTTIIGLISFPPAFGQYYASWLSSEQSMHELFSNITWGSIEFDDDHPSSYTLSNIFSIDTFLPNNSQNYSVALIMHFSSSFLTSCRQLANFNYFYLHQHFSLLHCKSSYSGTGLNHASTIGPNSTLI